MKDAEKWVEWLAAQNLIEDEMPNGYRIIMEMSPGDWSISLFDDEQNEIHIDDVDGTVDFINQAVRRAKRHKKLAISGEK